MLVKVCADLVDPRLAFSSTQYRLRLVEGRLREPPIIVKNRPREIVFNLAHPVFRGEIRPAVLEMVMALELAYLQDASGGDDELYDRVLALLADR